MANLRELWSSLTLPGKPAILARLLPFLDRFGDRATYRVLAGGKRWALMLIRRDDRINPADWERKAGK